MYTTNPPVSTTATNAAAATMHHTALSVGSEPLLCAPRACSPFVTLGKIVPTVGSRALWARTSFAAAVLSATLLVRCASPAEEEDVDDDNDDDRDDDVGHRALVQ